MAAIRPSTWIAVLGCLAAPALAAAQIVTGTISGYVVDPQGRPVPSATVRASDTLHGTSREASTDASGLFSLVDLNPGTFELAAVAEGFRPATIPVVPLGVNGRVRVDIRLELAGVVEHVDVRSEVRRTQAGSPELSVMFDRHQIDRLPLNRRDFLQLALFSAGIAAPVEDSELSSRGGVAMHANGAREEFNNFLLDGVDNNDAYTNRYVVQPPVDAVQEFRLAANSYSAEYGRSAGGQVNVITRGGSNMREGFGYEYFRDGALDARNFFDTEKSAEFRRHQFGAGAGGPIARDRAFFFVSADWLSERRGLSRLAIVPTEAERGGDLSALGITIVDPFTRKPFPGNVIPASRISPVARKVLDLFPLPNVAGRPGVYQGDPVLKDDERQLTARVDYQIGGSQQVSSRYSHGSISLFEPFAEDSSATPGFGDALEDRLQNAMVQHQAVLGTRAVNVLRFGYNRFDRDLLPENHGIDVGQLWGVSWLQLPERSYGFPMMNVAGYSRVGDLTGLPIIRTSQTSQVLESLTTTFGSHVVKTGVEFRHTRLESTLDLLTRGSLSFGGRISGSGISDLLLGYPSLALRAVADNPMDLRTTTIGAYVQDDWTVTPTLTLNAGIRYDYATPPVDPANKMSSLSPESGVVAPVGTAGISRSGVRSDRNNFGPRVGFAWSAAADLVVRGGYGIYYDSGMLTVNTAQYFNPPQFTMRVYFPSAAGLLTLGNPFAGGITPPAALNLLSSDSQTSFMHHWNVALQKDLGRVGVLTTAYAGSRGEHLIRPRDMNQPRPGPGDVQARRPYPQFGSMFLVETAGSSRYDALQITLDRRLTAGLTVLATYTLANSRDDASAFLETKTDRNFPQDSTDITAEWGPSSFDVRHRATIACTYAASPDTWAGNTQVRLAATFTSGQPFTPFLRFDNSNTGNGTSTTGFDRPNVVGDPHVNARGPDAWFNTAAFAVPPAYSFGDAGRNMLRGPGFASVDLSVARRFGLAHGRGLSLEGQVFNLFNRVNFEMPEPYADEPSTFGKIFAAKAPRQVQIVARFDF